MLAYRKRNEKKTISSNKPPTNFDVKCIHDRFDQDKNILNIYHQVCSMKKEITTNKHKQS